MSNTRSTRMSVSLAVLLTVAWPGCDEDGRQATSDAASLPDGPASHDLVRPRDAGAAEQVGDTVASDLGAPDGAKPLLGVYVGNDPKAVLAFETWLGCEVDGILGYTGNADWTDYDGSVGWAAGLWSAIDRRVLWSVPLIPWGATLEEAAAGARREPCHRRGP